MAEVKTGAWAGQQFSWQQGTSLLDTRALSGHFLKINRTARFLSRNSNGTQHVR
jgi:hypothetical protein